MPLKSGTLALRRYVITGAEDIKAVLTETLASAAFKGFEPDDQREMVFGWVTTDSNDPVVDIGSCLVDDRIVVTMRIDARKVPGKLVKQECAKVQEEWKRKLGREKLSRAERADIKETVYHSLLPKALPVCNCYDISIVPSTRELTLFSASVGVGDNLQGLFEKTVSKRMTLQPVDSLSIAVTELGAKPDWDPSADFLNWLWYRDQIQRQAENSESGQRAYIGDRISLASGNDTITIKAVNAADSEEVKKAVSTGWLITKAEVGVVFNQDCSVGMLDPGAFTLTGVKLPRVVVDGDGADEFESTTLLKVGMVDQYVELLTRMYKDFLAERNDASAWNSFELRLKAA